MQVLGDMRNLQQQLECRAVIKHAENWGVPCQYRQMLE